MKTVRFIADNAAEALAQIHAQIGPNAVVLSVRKLPAKGLARLWRRSGRIEVLAGVPEDWSADAHTRSPGSAAHEPADDGIPAPSSRRWRSVSWLEAMGLMPVHANRLQEHLNTVHGEPPPFLEDEWAVLSNALAGFWSDPPPIDDGGTPRPHVFIGPPGSGKSTVLCKWLTLAVLTEERNAHVWRLDGSSANTAEFLTIHCEMLGAPIGRFWTGQKVNADLLFIDLPGVEAGDEPGMAALHTQLASLPSPHIHLVLNAAYETTALMAQWRAFGALEPEDLIFTHLDEESRRVKLWNFLFGTNCSPRFLSAGQKIPGEFLRASPGLLFPSEIPR